MSDYARQEAPCLFIDPSPQDSTPQDTEKTYQAVTVGSGKHSGAQEGGRSKRQPVTKGGKQQSPEGDLLKDRRKDEVFD